MPYAKISPRAQELAEKIMALLEGENTVDGLSALQKVMCVCIYFSNNQNRDQAIRSMMDHCNGMIHSIAEKFDLDDLEKTNPQ